MLSEGGAAIVAKLGLIPHPEGGHYRETWRGPATGEGSRPTATAILFMLDQGERSHWHRVDADEIWLWHGGAPLDLLRAADDDGPVERIRLGPDVLAGETPQGVIPAGAWQATEANEGWGLVSCVVAPGFDFAGFTLAAPGWAPGGEEMTER
ncbi:cupin domain-containing protein [Sphingomonas naphthae]|uniref:Cupin domain-containing protein n=1 Tax=Sphingomonas naphthae TaxID=1813468 RepID=A0ABY7TKC2_9SPHN|nr:cupin domain-containing protein [Sphingomonas naphthae]WCT72835.1 cupin domain-containing protein [Sphingomonas naphthae]